MNSSRKFLLQLSVLAMTMNLVTACAANQTANIQKEPLRIEYTNWWGDYTLLVAQEKGLFEKYGISVEPVLYETYSDSYSDLAAGLLDGGLFVLGDAININDKSPLKVIAVYDDGGVDYLIGSSNIKTIADLKGKKIGVDISSAGELVVQQALKQGGLKVEEVILVDMAVEELSNHLGSTVDAGYSWDPYASEALANGANILYKGGGTNTIGPDVIVFNANTLEKRSEDIRSFLKAWFEAVDYRNANPQDANQIISAMTGLSMDQLTVDAQIYTLEENMVLLSDQSPQNMINLTSAFNANAEFLLDLGVLSKQPDKNQFIDSSFLFQ
jgi:NitT/TauT family transport system substrate-binding protein